MIALWISISHLFSEWLIENFSALSLFLISLYFVLHIVLHMCQRIFSFRRFFSAWTTLEIRETILIFSFFDDFLFSSCFIFTFVTSRTSSFPHLCHWLFVMKSVIRFFLEFTNTAKSIAIQQLLLLKSLKHPNWNVPFPICSVEVSWKNRIT